MHVGGIHLVFGLFFLVLSIFLAALTVYGGYIFVAFLHRVLALFRVVYLKINNWINSLTSSPGKSLAVSFLPWWNRSFFLKSLSVLVVIFVVSYGWQRCKWMGDDNRYYAAKEYWVAGQPLSGFRYALNHVLHPDNPLVRHLTLYQQLIYKCGIACLPDDDGEKGVWRGLWFHRLYYEKLDFTYGDDAFKPASKRMIYLLDDVWESLDIMGDNRFADNEMRALYYRIFHKSANYYVTFDGCYMGVHAGSASNLLKNTFYVNRLLLLNDWLSNLELELKKNKNWEVLWNNDPMCVAEIVDVSMSIKQSLISYFAFSKTFSCNNPIITALYKQYYDLMTDDSQVSIALRLSEVDWEKAVTFYKHRIYHSRGHLGQYVFTKVCGERLPKGNPGLRLACANWVMEDVSVFNEEVSCIKEALNE